jgi:hypothetical protein
MPVTTSATKMNAQTSTTSLRSKRARRTDAVSFMLARPVSPILDRNLEGWASPSGYYRLTNVRLFEGESYRAVMSGAAPTA